MAASCSAWVRWSVPLRAKYRTAANSASIQFSHDAYVGRNTRSAPGLGFTDEVSDADIKAIVAETRRRSADLPPLELSLGLVDPDAEGVGLLVRPWDRVEHLRATIRDALGTVWPSVPEPAQDSGRTSPSPTAAHQHQPNPYAPGWPNSVTSLLRG